MKCLKNLRRIDDMVQIVPYLFSLGCARAWMTLTFASPTAVFAPFNVDPHVLFDYVYVIAGVAVALLAHRVAPLQEHASAKALALGAMLASSACIIGASYAPEAAAVLQIIAALVGGCGFCLLLLLHSEALVPLGLVRIALYTAGSRFMAVPMVFFCEGLDDVRFNCALIVLPLVAVACVSYAYGTTPAEDRPSNMQTGFAFPWKPIALLSVFSFAYGLRSSQLAAGAGIHSSLSTALVMGVFFLVVYFFSHRFSISALIRSPLVLMVCGFVLIPLEGVFGPVVSSYLISMANTLMSLLMSLLLYDFSKRLGVAVVVFMGFAKVSTLFSVWGNDCANLLARTPLAPQMQDAVIMAVVVLLVLCCTLILLSEKDITATWGIHVSSPTGKDPAFSRDEFLTRRCDEVSRKGRLSPREDEILRLMAKGKSNLAMENELFIAPGTLKAHIQHIYVKLDIHSRKDLMALFEAPADEKPLQQP